MTKTEWGETDYRQAHKRVRYHRGKARDQRCLTCGEPARQWALIEKMAREAGMFREGWFQMWGRPRAYWVRWSPDPFCYAALCLECHVHRDGLAHPRRERAKNTHCKAGHPFAGDNLYLWVSPKTGQIHRRCKTCQSASKAATYAAKKAGA